MTHVRVVISRTLTLF